MSLDRQRALRLATGYRLQWEPAQNAHVLLYPEGMVRLGGSAGEILLWVNGTRGIDDILAELHRQFPGAELDAETITFLNDAHERGWIIASA